MRSLDTLLAEDVGKLKVVNDVEVEVEAEELENSRNRIEIEASERQKELEVLSSCSRDDHTLLLFALLLFELLLPSCVVLPPNRAR